MGKSVLLFSISALRIFTIANAFGTVQDFCVADLTVPVSGSGPACKNPATVTTDDFFFSSLQTPENTTNPYGAAIKAATLSTMPGLNTLGISLARLDFAPNGVIPPHTHPRATEIITVLEGSLQVGFVTSNPNYSHMMKVLQKDDVFVVPAGLVHYQFNAGSGYTVAITALNSENPGIIALPSAIFGTKPDLDSGNLSKAFQLDRKIVDELLTKF